MKCVEQICRISIVFCLLFLCTRCQRATDEISLTLVSKNHKTVGIAIQGLRLEKHELASRLKVQLIKPGKRVPVLGEFKITDGQVVFESHVPLTRNLQYELLLDDELLGELQIPAGAFIAPEVVSIYPSSDTLPVNLLKIYLAFSAPMAEGNSLRYTTLIRNEIDTLKNTFLDLQPELWNADGTVLTLWLDPGRIKQGLIPNKELGAPLNPHEKYVLHVSDAWQSKEGLQLSKTYSKRFITTTRDDHSPDITQWKIIAPASGTRRALEIHSPEALDYFLWKETVTIKNSNGETIQGVFETTLNEKVLKFLPEALWIKGSFALHVEDRLEDLSGNNLNHPFDRVIATQNHRHAVSENTRLFEIE